MTVRIFGENGAMVLLNIVIVVSSVNGANMIHIHGKMESVPYVDMDLNIIQYWTFKRAGNHPLNVDCLHFYSQFIFISSLFRSIYFHLMFPPLCPFSSVLFRISFWFPDDFGLFPYFSLFYVHMEEYGRLRTAKSCTEADKKVSNHSLFVPKTAFPTAIIRIGKI